MQDFLYPVPADNPDEPEFITVQFNIHWLAYILDAVDNFEPSKVWDNPPADIRQRVDTLLTLLVTDVTMPPQVFSEIAYHFHRDSTVISGNAITWASVTGSHFAGIWSQGAAQAGDQFRFFVFLRAGTYKLRFNWRRLGSAGKMNIKIDNTTVVSLFDMYGSTSDAQIADEEIAIMSDGMHQVDCDVGSKNSSSTGYNAQIGAFYFRRTGS